MARIYGPSVTGNARVRRRLGRIVYNPASSAGSSTPTTPSYGVRAVAANSEYLSIADASQTGLNAGVGDWSLACWFYADTTGANQGLVSKKNVPTDVSEGYALRLNASDVPQALMADGTGIVSLLFGSAVVADTLYCAIMTLDRDGVMTLIINNASETSTNISARSASMNNAVDFRIARAGATYFGGGVVCVGVWNSVLDATAKTAIYNSGSPLLYSALPGTVPAPVSYWNLDEQSDGSAPVTRMDATASNNDLTDNNTTPSSAFPFTG